MDNILKSCREQFEESLKTNDPKDLLRTWYERSNDDFYNILKDIKCLVDNLPQKPFKETNPIVFAMIAYCFDGNKGKTLAKTREILGECLDINQILPDELMEKFIDLEKSAEDTSTLLLNSSMSMRLLDSYSIILYGIDNTYAIDGRSFRAEKTNKGITYYFEAYGDQNDLEWIKEKFFEKDTNNQYLQKNFTISLMSETQKKKYYDLIYLTDIVPLSYTNNIDTNQTILLEFISKNKYLCSDSGIKIIEEVKKNINDKINLVYNS